MKAIIFDYNRTLFDPDTGSLFPGVSKFLLQLKAEGFRLFLVAKGGEDRRQQVADMGLEPFFEKIIINPEKTPDDFIQCQETCSPDTDFYVVGDRVKKEIRFGNELGMTTVWLKTGKFADELPEDTIEKPDHTITELLELEPLID